MTLSKLLGEFVLLLPQTLGSAGLSVGVSVSRGECFHQGKQNVTNYTLSNDYYLVSLDSSCQKSVGKKNLTILTEVIDPLREIVLLIQNRAERI